MTFTFVAAAPVVVEEEPVAENATPEFSGDTTVSFNITDTEGATFAVFGSFTDAESDSFIVQVGETDSFITVTVSETNEISVAIDRENAVAGSYPIDLKVSDTDAVGNSRTTKKTVTVEIKEAE